jgi:20S proteasome alpha/beta subunit
MMHRPLFHRPIKQRRLPEREDMTLCIAAIAQDYTEHHFEASFVFCSDTRVETQTTGSDTEFKFHKVTNEWAAMVAGDVGRAQELLSMYSSYLTGKLFDPNTVLDELRVPAQELKKKLSNEYIANTTGLSFDDFVTRGKESLPSGLFDSLWNEVARIQIGCELILIPVPQDKALFVVDIDGEVHLRRNFCTIGSGSSSAEAWLHHRVQKQFYGLKRTLIHSGFKDEVQQG